MITAYSLTEEREAENILRGALDRMIYKLQNKDGNSVMDSATNDALNLLKKVYAILTNKEVPTATAADRPDSYLSKTNCFALIEGLPAAECAGSEDQT